MKGPLGFRFALVCVLGSMTGSMAGCHGDTESAGSADAGKRDVTPDAGTSPDAGGGAGGAPASSEGGVPRALKDVVADYAAAWGATDDAERQRLLRAAYAEDGVYSDTIAANSAANRAAFLGVIGQFQKTYPGATIVPTTIIDGASSHFRFGWKVVLAAGNALVTGEDEGETGDDGRIRRITGFFDSPTGVAAPPALTALLKALNDSDHATREADLADALTEDVSWSDRWMGATTRAEVLDHFDTWLTPPAGTVFTLVGDVDLHDDLFRANLTMENSTQQDEAQLFGHIGPDGILDWVSFFDGKLASLP